MSCQYLLLAMRGRIRAGRPGTTRNLLESVPSIRVDIRQHSAAASISFANSTRTNRTVLLDRKSTRLNSSHANISYAVFCLKKQIQDFEEIVAFTREFELLGRPVR